MSQSAQKLLPGKELTECGVCGRHFAIERVKIHEAICQKSYGVTKKCFDISAQRIKGTEAEKLLKSNMSDCFYTPYTTCSCPVMSTNWRKKHEELIKDIQDAKELVDAKSKKQSDLPFLPRIKNHSDDYVECQHCSTKINQMSTSKHVAACLARICEKKSKTNSSSTTNH